jgi:hypothetical protein
LKTANNAKVSIVNKIKQIKQIKYNLPPSVATLMSSFSCETEKAPGFTCPFSLNYIYSNKLQMVSKRT